MTNNANEEEFEKLSFWQLLKSRCVEIPIIQRDYAQGRSTKEKVRNDFLESLKEALTGSPIELDFIYGSEKNNTLLPLDGQQRLTTLYLLHWYIANKEGKLSVVKEVLLRFSYETRASSREFCKELIDKSIDYKNLLVINSEKKITSENQLSETIKNAAWFVISWENDPTISAMLTMLDAIHVKFKDCINLWQKLFETTEGNRPITFLYIKLENFGLSDDLYIKMNARGKALTPFENFKSRFGEHIKKNVWEKEKTNPQETFSHKIDTVWTDLFWKYRDKIENRDENGNVIIEFRIDDKLTNFIAGIAISYYAQGFEIQSNYSDEEKVRKELQEKGKTKNISDNAIKRERIERRMVVLFNSPNEITPDDFPIFEAFKYLVNCLDIYSQNNNAELKSDIDLWKYCKGSLFNDSIKNEKLVWQNRVIFYAQTTYLLNTTFDKNTFNDWIRVVRNIVENSTIDSATTFIAAVNLIQEISSGCSNIYNYFSKNYPKAKHAEVQVKEEILKASTIVSDSSTKKIIHDLEDTSFFRGRIYFAFYCIDYNISNNETSNSFDKEKLKDIFSVVTSNFAFDDTILSSSFKRAFLTIGNNDYYEVWGSWSWSFNCNKRWLLKNNEDLKIFAQSEDWKRNYLKELFNLLVKRSFQQIIDDYVMKVNYKTLPEWKQQLIKEDKLMNNATFILVPQDNSYCKLAWQQKPSREDQVVKVE